ncbi:MAG: flippase activity-associated protein Agl23 [Chloroflexota bacterium]
MQGVNTESNENRTGGWSLDRPLAEVLALDWEKALYLAIIAVAVISRFWDLGARALHHDESLHATYSYYLFTGRGYVHDPLLHGTFIYHFNALVYLLFGASNASARYAPAFLSVLTVCLPYFLRKELGRTGALVASGLFLISPSFLYFGRFIREDAHIAFFTLAIVVCLFRYLDSRRPVFLYLFAALFALSFNTKESTYMLAAVYGLFFLAVAGPEVLQLLRRTKGFSPAGDFLVVLSTLTLTQLAGFAILYRHLSGRAVEAYAAPEDYAILLAAFTACCIIAIVVGLRWNARVWLITAGAFLGVFTIFFTTMFSNPAGFFSGAIGGLVYWLAQQEVRRGAQPWYYYFVLMPVYEYLVLAFAIPGALYFLKRRSLFTSLMIFWATGNFLLYSWAGEKMPWLILHLALPLVLLAARFLAVLIDGGRWRERVRERATLVGAAVIGMVLALALANSPRPFGGALNSLRSQQVLFQWLAMSVLLAVLAYFGLRAAERLGLRAAARTLAVGSLVILVPLTVHTATQAAFTNGDVAVEMIVYTQTTPDVTKVMGEIEQIGFRTGAGKDLKVAYDADATWPFEWYLRDYRNRNFYGTGTPAPDAPVVIAGMENNNDARIKSILGSKYVGQRYRLRWWFPEDYQSADAWLRALTPEDKRAALPQTFGNVSVLDIAKAMLQSEARARLWRYFIYRDTLNPLGSTDFMLYIRKDLVEGGWVPASVAATTAVVDDQLEAKTRTLPATLAVAGTDQPLRDPKGVAVAPDRSIYVLDTGASTVVHYDQTGKLIDRWGGVGEAAGQFREPWGIAVDAKGLVYVADTWNHRVQVFDAKGQFVRQWGAFGDTRDQAGVMPGTFYGPRSLTFDKDGNVLVVDTGNERVEKFSPDGAFIAQYGGFGSGDGAFVEPVGIGVDGQGNVYVADTWNHRIQKFDAQFRYLAQWDVPTWMSESVINKPYLAVDGAGNVYVTDPEWHRVIKYTSQGVADAAWGKYGADASSFNLPFGVAVDKDGNVFVADSGNKRVEVFPPVR